MLGGLRRRIDLAGKLPSWTTQHRDDAIRLIQQKQICRASGQLNDQSAKLDRTGLIFASEGQTNNTVLWIFIDIDQRGAIRLRAEQLTKVSKLN